MKELFEGAIKFREEDFNEHKELYESLKKRQGEALGILLSWGL